MKAYDVSSSRPGVSYFHIGLWTAYFLAAAIYAYLLYDGSSFYRSPFMERPHMEQYRILRPAGIKGHTFGVIGSTFMILMLAYSLRKRTKILRGKGQLSRWLDIHIFFGVMGPLLVVLHTSFKVQGLVAVSFWSMVAVASSGIFGRYLYLQIPRNTQGDELSLKELEETNRQYAKRLKEEFNLDDELIRKLESRYSSDLGEDAGMLKVLVTALGDDILRPFRRSGKFDASAELKEVPANIRKEIISIFRRKASLTRRIMMFDRIQQMFHYWHVIHKPFAFIMYTVMIVHVVVAIWTGYKWIF